MPRPNNHGLLKPYNIVIDEGNNTARIDIAAQAV